MLNSSRQSYREKFVKELDEQLNIYNIEKIIQKPSLTYQEIEQIDELIARILNVAQKKVEGLFRNIPYSKEKVNHQGTLLYQKSKVRKLKGGVVDEEVMSKRKKSIILNAQTI